MASWIFLFFTTLFFQSPVFLHVHALTTVQYEHLVVDLRAAIDSAQEDTRDVYGGLLRLAFHDAFGLGTTMDGCLDPEEHDHNGP